MHCCHDSQIKAVMGFPKQYTRKAIACPGFGLKLGMCANNVFGGFVGVCSLPQSPHVLTSYDKGKWQKIESLA